MTQLGRLEIDVDSSEFTRLLAGVHVWPLTLEICRRVRDLDFSSDPADEIIAATSMVHKLPLLTRDRVILRSKMIEFA